MKILNTIVCLSALAFVVNAEEEGKKRPGAGDADRRAEMMKRFDKDGDGTLSDTEKAAAKEAMAKAGKTRGDKGDPARKKALMEKFDKDGDGKLSDEEKAAAKEAMEGRNKELIGKFDKDGDGTLNEEERAAAKKALEDKKAAGGEKKETE